MKNQFENHLKDTVYFILEGLTLFFLTEQISGAIQTVTVTTIKNKEAVYSV